MTTTRITLTAIAALIIAACGSSKKTTASSTPVPLKDTTAAVTPASTPMVFAKPANGVYAPGTEELAAIQVQYNDVTQEKLMEGYTLYTAGACINCHGAKNIYRRSEAQWKTVMDDMAVRAKISDKQKDAVYKYVLAIKATQPKESK